MHTVQYVTSLPIIFTWAKTQSTVTDGVSTLTSMVLEIESCFNLSTRQEYKLCGTLNTIFFYEARQTWMDPQWRI